MANLGDIIDEKYEILRLIGEGGMSKVYLAMDMRLNKQWAVKEITKRARDMDNEVVIHSAIAEANMIKKLDHPALPRIVDIIDNGDMIYVIMDYIEGETLANVLKTDGPQPQELVVEWALQLCDVLDYLHTRQPPIIYRDMKPENVMLKPDGTIKLIDFGIAREYKEHKTSDTIGLGTRGYAAPEQFGGKQQTDARTDVYCLGMTMHHLLTGKNPSEPPYEIYPIRHWDPRLSTGLEAIVQKCINLDPPKRYQSCAELTYALYHYEQMGADYIAEQRSKLHWFIVSVAAMLGCLAVGFVGMGMKNYSNSKDYQQKIAEANAESDSEQKEALYMEAIDLIPTDIEAYQLLIDEYKKVDEGEEVDTPFSKEEEKLFTQKVREHITALKNSSDYPELAYMVGELYWYNYDYGKESVTSESGDNNVERSLAAMTWFKEVIDNEPDQESMRYKMATVYYQIGEFNSKIQEFNKTAKWEGRYKEYFTTLQNLEQLVEDGKQDSAEYILMMFESFNLIENQINTHVDKFKLDGISYQDMMNLHKTVIADASATRTPQDEKDRSNQLRDKILGEQQKDVESKINRIYGEEEDAK